MHAEEKALEVVQSVGNSEQLSAVCRDWLSFQMSTSPSLGQQPVSGGVLTKGLRAELRSLPDPGSTLALALALTSYLI